MIKTLIALPYELARLPILVVDNNLSGRLPESSATRLTLDRAIGATDKLAGALLGDHTIAKRGVDRLDRSDQLRAATRLEEEAASRREQARETANTGRRKAAQKRKAAQDRAASGLQEADAAEARGKEEALKKARKDAAAKKTAADKRAASRKATAEQRKERVENAAEATKQGAQRKAKAELKDASQTRQSAVAARSDAERLSDLAETKKQDRKQS